MTLEDAVFKFRRHLEDHYNGKQGSREWMKCDCRTICNACTNKRYKPFYISVTGESPIYMKCFKISSDINRFATPEDFEAFGFTDKEAIKLLVDRNNRVKIKHLDTSTRPIIVNDYIMSSAQQNYWKKRTGKVPDINELAYYRFICDIDSVMNENFEPESDEYISYKATGNYWKKRTGKVPDINELAYYRFICDIDSVMNENFEPESDEYISYKATGIRPGKTGCTFLTSDYGMVSYRGIDDGKKIKFNINSNTSYGYTLQRGHIVKSLVIAEGIFDIINIHNIFAYMDEALYCAALGFNSFENDICYWYQQHVDTIEQLIIFADSDIKQSYGHYTYKSFAINNLVKRLKERLGETAFKRIYVCYNAKGKDFGDLSSPIEGERVEIK